MFVEKLLAVQVGGIIRLSDEVTKSEFNGQEATFTVEKQRLLESQNDEEKNYLFHLKHESGVERLLMLTTFRDQHDVRVFMVPDGYVADARDVLFNEERAWMFVDGEFECPAAVPYSDNVFDADQNDFMRKQRDEVFHDGEFDTSVVQYRTAAEISNDEVMFIETGHFTNENGGFIEMYIGRLIDDKDVHLGKAGFFRRAFKL